MRRKHAALIHAWAEGADIQFRTDPKNTWMDCGRFVPEWNDDYEYRVKPKTVRFRNYLNKDGKIYATDQVAAQRGNQFVKWIGDWLEVEIEL